VGVYLRGWLAASRGIYTTRCSVRLLCIRRALDVSTRWRHRRQTDNIRYNPHHVLHQLLPDKNDYTYNLRPRRHSFSLTSKNDRRSFVNRLLYKDIYYSNVLLYPLYPFSMCVRPSARLCLYARHSVHNKFFRIERTLVRRYRGRWVCCFVVFKFCIYIAMIWV